MLVRILLCNSQGKVGFVALPLAPKKLIPGKACVQWKISEETPCAQELLESRIQKGLPPFGCLGKVQ